MTVGSGTDISPIGYSYKHGEAQLINIEEFADPDVLEST